MSSSGVCEAYWRAINRQPIAAVNDLRIESLRRLDELRVKRWSRNIYGGSGEGHH